MDIWRKSPANRDNGKHKGPGVSAQKIRGGSGWIRGEGGGGYEIPCGCAWGRSCSTLKATLSTLSSMNRRVSWPDERF